MALSNIKERMEAESVSQSCLPEVRTRRLVLRTQLWTTAASSLRSGVDPPRELWRVEPPISGTPSRRDLMAKIRIRRNRARQTGRLRTLRRLCDPRGNCPENTLDGRSALKLGLRSPRERRGPGNGEIDLAALARRQLQPGVPRMFRDCPQSGAIGYFSIISSSAGEGPVRTSARDDSRHGWRYELHWTPSLLRNLAIS